MRKRAHRSRTPRTDTITFRLRTDEKARLEADAIEAGLTLSGYISALVDKRITSLKSKLAEMHEPQTRRPEPRTLHPEVMRELSRIGNNINQIAHALNSGLPPDFRHSVIQLQKLMTLIYENNLHKPSSDTGTSGAANDGSPSSQARHEFQRRV
ncbi:MAG: MobC family plasmid mobilization relaxosome protein [Hyphomicrobiaceae bacterium]